MKSLILLILIVPVLSAQTNNDFTHLKQYGGDYYSDQVLNDSKVNPILKKMMGKEYQHLRDNLSVTGAVDVISGAIVIQGNADHKGGEEMAIIDINPFTTVIRTAIFSKGKITVYCSKESDEYFKSTDYFSLPVSIKDWIAVVITNLEYRMNKPSNVLLK